MYKFISFIVIFSLVSVLLYFHNQNSHFQASHQDGHHQDHEKVEVPPGREIPKIRGTVTEDYSGSWLLSIETDHFKFAPEKAGHEAPAFNEGHAHIYLDGEKINRLYGNYYNLGELEKGEHEIKVTLNANNHDLFAINGKEIAYIEKFEVK